MIGPPRSQSFSGCTPVRLDGDPAGPIGGMGMWRGCKDFEHATLCRVFGLDPVRFYFDLPSSVRGVGSSSSGYGGAQRSGRRLQNGLVLMSAPGGPIPVGKLTICFESERFRDVDPTDARDFYDLSHS